MDCNFIKRRFQHKCFPMKIVKFLGTPIFTNTLWLLLAPTHGVQKTPKINVMRKDNCLTTTELYHRCVP